MPPTTPLNRQGDAILMNWGMRTLVDREALVLTRPEGTAPLVVRRVAGAFSISYYGAGRVLGSRGHWLVLGSGGRR